MLQAAEDGNEFNLLKKERERERNYIFEQRATSTEYFVKLT